MSFLFVFTLILGFYMAWNIGANDVANAMGTSVGSKALTLKKAVYLAAILEFSGAFFVGASVSETIQHGIVSPQIFQENPTVFVLGMMGALLTTGVLLQFASYFGLPLSTTHAIVGSVIGFGAIVGGIDAVQWEKVAQIASSWILSPFLSGVISYSMFRWIQKKVFHTLDPTDAARKLVPLLIFLCFFVVALSFLGLKQIAFNVTLVKAFSLATAIGVAAALSSYWIFQPSPFPESNRVRLFFQSRVFKQSTLRVQANASEQMPASDHAIQHAGVENLFVYLQILSACLVAFAHGANDVANAIGPVSAVMGVLKTNTLGTHTDIPLWLLALGGGGIVLGLATWGWRVIETIGSKITELTPTRGFCAEFGAAFTILLASKFGFPISTTHALVGAVFGVGMVRGIQALNLQMLKEIVISWIFTVPLCACLSILVFYALNFVYTNCCK